MGDWQQILFERRVLTWATLMVFLGTGLWVAALATPYWLIHIPVDDERIIWGHSGIWQKCDLVEENEKLQWECWDSFRMDSSSLSTMLRSELSLSGVTLLLTIGALIFSWYSINHPKYTYRRLAAVLHLLVAASLLAVIQLVDSETHHMLHDADSAHLLYGYSYLLAWCSFLVSISAAITFLLASRKRKLLDNENVDFRHQKLDIFVPVKR